MDRRDSQMEAADPGDHFGSHAEIFMELHDQMAPAASEFLRKPRQIDMIRRLLEYPPCLEQARWRGRCRCQSRSDCVFDDVKPRCPVGCGLRMTHEESRK